MTLDHRFSSDCDQDAVRGASCGLGEHAATIASAFVLVGLVVASTTAIAARAAIVSIAPAMAAIYAGVGLPVNLRGLSIADTRVSLTQQAEGQGELCDHRRDRQSARWGDVCAGSALGATGRGWARGLCLDIARAEDQPQRSGASSLQGPVGGAAGRRSRRSGKIRRAGR